MSVVKSSKIKLDQASYDQGLKGLFLSGPEGALQVFQLLMREETEDLRARAKALRLQADVLESQASAKELILLRPHCRLSQIRSFDNPWED